MTFVAKLFFLANSLRKIRNSLHDSVLSDCLSHNVIGIRRCATRDILYAISCLTCSRQIHARRKFSGSNFNTNQMGQTAIFSFIGYQAENVGSFVVRDSQDNFFMWISANSRTKAILRTVFLKSSFFSHKMHFPAYFQ